MRWALLLVLSGAIVVLAYWLVRSRPRLVVTDRGILDRSLGLGWICWDEIEGAYRSRPGVSLRLRPETRAARRLGRRRDPAAGPLTVRVDLDGTNVTPVELLQAVVARGGREEDELRAGRR
jgi:hypothetical protein